MAAKPMADDSASLLCPSARCEEGAYLIGVVGADGVVGYLSPLIEIDSSFVRQAHQGRDPERRFRFAQPCVEGRCANWDGSRCQIIDQALVARRQAALEVESGLPRCGIRRACRWFAQVGPEACRTCPLVITELPTRQMVAARSD